MRAAQDLVCRGLTLSLLVCPALAQASDLLPALAAATTGSTVSGLSSGAFMSVQMHIAHSSRIEGAAILAGGPYYCAEGSPKLAQQRCMATTAGKPDGKALAQFARQTAAAGKIDPVEHLASSRLFIFGGTADPVVTAPVVSSLIDFYRALGVPAANIKTVTRMKAGHTMPTKSFGNPCEKTLPPFIGNCNQDQAGELLQQLYGKLNAPAAQMSGRLLSFDQGKFIADARQHGMDDTAFVWLPKVCEAKGGNCRVHVVFHGCLQGREHLGEVYATLTGYNRWADTNRLIVLYPQAVTTATNPNGCWDWFAYDDAAYYTREGRQIKAVTAMIDRLQSPLTAGE